jgi:hypothetical protein
MLDEVGESARLVATWIQAAGVRDRVGPFQTLK